MRCLPRPCPYWLYGRYEGWDRVRFYGGQAWIYLAAVLSCARANTHNTQHTAHGPSPFDPVLTRMREKRPSAPPPSSPSVRSVGQAVESERALPVLAEAILDAGSGDTRMQESNAVGRRAGVLGSGKSAIRSHEGRLG